MRSLQSTIFFFFVLLLLVVQGIFLSTIFEATRSQEQEQVDSTVGTALTVFKTQYDSRRYYLDAFAATAAKDFGLKQVFREDLRSFMVALNNHKERIGADVAMAISADGDIIAQLITETDDENKRATRMGPEHQTSFRYQSWLINLEASHLYDVGDSIYQLSIAPIKSGAMIIGSIGFGYSIDSKLADDFENSTGLSTAFALRRDGKWDLIASSASYDLAKSSTGVLISTLVNEQQDSTILATHHPMGKVGEQTLVAIMIGDRNDLLQAIQQRWIELSLLGLTTLSLSLLGAYLISARISRPIQQLVLKAREIAKGSYQEKLDIDAINEFGQLADEFNLMQEAVLSREKLITHMAFHESLSGLPNLNALLAAIKERFDQPSTDFALARIDIKRIKEVNASLGHVVGNELIKEVSLRLVKHSGAGSVYHLGGGEFGVLLENVKAQNSEGFLQQLAQAMSQVFYYRLVSLHPEIEVGLAFYEPGVDTEHRLIQRALIALHQAQKEGVYARLYNQALEDASKERTQIINDLDAALASQQFVIHYQPKLNYALNQVMEVEALIRWRHPQKGMIPPDRFIPVAEQTGQIDAITDWVIEDVMSQSARWRTEGVELTVAVNISAQNLKAPTFYSHLMSTLEKHQLAPSEITLEMTESVLVDDPGNAIAVLNRFRDAGLGISIDDFGTGYSSLSQLRNLPVTELKIDKSFVMPLMSDPESQTIVKSCIELAHNMHLHVVAEGIEDRETLDWLGSMGCDIAQGYVISRPIPAKEFIEWYQTSVFKQPIRKSVS